MKLILLLCSAASLGTASFSPGEDAPYSVYEEEASVHGHALQKIKHQTGERHGPRHGPIRAHRDLSDHNGDAPETWDSSKMMHGMIIDAGSGGSRMHVYAWAPREFDKGEYGEGSAFCSCPLLKWSGRVWSTFMHKTHGPPIRSNSSHTHRFRFAPPNAHTAVCP